MLSNFQMVKSFKYNPEHEGFCTEGEVKLIKEHFEIDKRSNIELQNLRDFVVLLYSQIENKLLANDNYSHDEYRKVIDTMSAITGVIDNCKFNRGMEV